ncbi:MAG: ComEA family DNA-binding protein [Anaerolineales bacterium]
MNWKPLLYIVAGILIGFLAAGLLYLTVRAPEGQPVTLLPTQTPRSLVVYVTGAVATPGVYILPPGSRVADAVEAAGGFAEGAEQERINLAALLQDGEQIDVPGVAATSRVLTQRVNINTATVDELDDLPGIGPTAAQSIVDYRLANGPFQTIWDLQNVPGIGPATFDRIKDYVTVGP